MVTKVLKHRNKNRRQKILLLRKTIKLRKARSMESKPTLSLVSTLLFLSKTGPQTLAYHPAKWGGGLEPSGKFAQLAPPPSFRPPPPNIKGKYTQKGEIFKNFFESKFAILGPKKHLFTQFSMLFWSFFDVFLVIDKSTKKIFWSNPPPPFLDVHGTPLASKI